MLKITGKLVKYVDLVLNRANGVSGVSPTTGKVVPAVRTPQPPIKANIQPLKYSQIMMMSDADRTREWKRVFSTSEIRKAEEKKWDADTFEYEGNTYKVMAVRSYKMGTLEHYEAKAALDSPTPRGG